MGHAPDLQYLRLMRLYPSFILVGALSLPCSSGALGGPAHKDMMNVLGAVTLAPPETVMRLLAAGSTEINLAQGDCAGVYQAIANVDPAQKEALIAKGFPACKAKCSPEAAKWSTSPDPVGAIVAVCEADGAPDTVFGGTLTGFRAQMSPGIYLAFRHLIERWREATSGDAELSREVEIVRTSLAVALDQSSPETGDSPFVAARPEDAPIIIGAVDTAEVTRILTGTAFSSCGTSMELRMVIDADGGVRDVWGAGERAIQGSGGAGRQYASASAKLEDCVLDLALPLKFPATRDGDVALVAWPVQPVGGAPAEGGAALASGTLPPGVPVSASAAPDGGLVVVGGLDKDVVARILARQVSNVQYCYEKGLRADPTLAGRVTVEFVIAKDGTVSSAITKGSTLNNPAVESCLGDRFMRFQFPEPDGDVTVSYPLRLGR